MRIVSVKHKGLRRLLELGDPKSIKQEHLPRICEVLTELCSIPAPLYRKNLRHHPILCKSSQGEGVRYSVSVNGSWRLVFSRDAENNIHNLDYINYH